MYACGVTTAGLMNRRKKNPPIKEHIDASLASGYFLYSTHTSSGPSQTSPPWKTYPGERSDLLADPPDPVRHGIQTIDDRGEEGVCDLHEHGQAGEDDGLDVRVGRRDFGRDAAG